MVPPPPPLRRSPLATYGLASVGLELAFSALIGFGSGYWLDIKLGTQPWFLLVMGLLGTIAGFRSLIRAAKRATRAAAERSAGQDSSGDR